MKKILSMGLAVTMAMAALPTAFAAETQDYTLGSQVAVIGNAASEYEIKVPARLEAGASGNVVVTGTWKSNEYLVVTADKEIEVTNEETGATTKVAVSFNDIDAVGNDLAAMSITETVTVDQGNILFGTWAGIVTYDAELIEVEEFTIDGVGELYGAKAMTRMTWGEWVASEYNTADFVVTPDNTIGFWSTEYDDNGYYMTIKPTGSNYKVLATDVISPDLKYMASRG